MWFIHNAWLIPLIPAVSFLVILAIGKRLGEGAAFIGIASVGASFLLAVGTAIQWIRQPTVEGVRRAYDHNLFTWWESGASGKQTGRVLKFPFGIHVDGLTVMM